MVAESEKYLLHRFKRKQPEVTKLIETASHQKRNTVASNIGCDLLRNKRTLNMSGTVMRKLNRTESKFILSGKDIVITDPLGKGMVILRNNKEWNRGVHKPTEPWADLKLPPYISLLATAIVAFWLTGDDKFRPRYCYLSNKIENDPFVHPPDLGADLFGNPDVHASVSDIRIIAKDLVKLRDLELVVREVFHRLNDMCKSVKVLANGDKGCYSNAYPQYVKVKYGRTRLTVDDPIGLNGVMLGGDSKGSYLLHQRGFFRVEIEGRTLHAVQGCMTGGEGLNGMRLGDGYELSGKQSAAQEVAGLYLT